MFRHATPPLIAVALLCAALVSVCAGIAAPAATPGWDRGPVAVEPGGLYHAEAWVRAADEPSAGAPVRLVLRQSGPEGGTGAEWSSPPVALTTGWQRVEVMAAPASPEPLAVTVTLPGARAGQGFDVDALAISRRPDPSAPDGGPVPAPTPPQPEIVPVGGCSFESGADGWAAGGGTLETVALAGAPDGGYVARLTATGDGDALTLGEPADATLAAAPPPAAATPAATANRLADLGRRSAWFTNWASPSQRIAEVPRSEAPAGGPPDTTLTHAIRVEMRDGDPQMPYDEANGGKRHELQTGTMWQTGDVRWVGWWEYVDTWPAVNRDWQIVFQAKQGGGTSPGVDVQEWADSIRLVTPWASVNTPLSAPLPRGRWFHVAIGFRMTTDAARGWAEMWIDGRQVGARFTGKTAQLEGPVYVKTGLYRSDSITGTSIRYVAGMSVFSDRPAPGALSARVPAPVPTPVPAPVRSPVRAPAPTPTPAPARPVLRTSPVKGAPPAPARVVRRYASPFVTPQ